MSVIFTHFVSESGSDVKDPVIFINNHLPQPTASQLPLERRNERELIVHSEIVAGRISTEASVELKNEVFTNMKNDEISRVAISDPLICCLGNASMKRNIGNKFMRRYNVSSDMRLAARCLMALRELQEGEEAQKNLDWYDALIPSQYDNIVLAVFNVCRENVMNPMEEDDDVDTDDLEAPSNANTIKLSYDIARLCSIKITQAVNLDDAELSEKTRKETKRFMEKFKYNWSADVKKRAQHVRRESKLNTEVGLPDPKYIAPLAKYPDTSTSSELEKEAMRSLRQARQNSVLTNLNIALIEKCKELCAEIRRLRQELTSTEQQLERANERLKVATALV